MVIDVIDESSYLTEAQVELIQAITRQAAQQLQLPEGIEVDISIVSNEEIQVLNREYRQIDKPTDVLSFAMSEVTSEYDVDFDSLMYDESEDEQEPDEETAVTTQFETHLGDIIMSYPRAVEQAAEYGHSLERELGFLAVHGFLHLNGYDHQTEEEAKAMFALQEEVLAAYGLTR